MRYKAAFLAFVILSILAGCAPYLIGGKVSTIAMSEPRGTTYAIVGQKVPTISDMQLQAEIHKRMQAKGFSINESPAIVVLYEYNIGNGRTSSSNWNNLVTGRNEVHTTTYFDLWFRLILIDGESAKSGQVLVIWQGEVSSTGSNTNMAELAPYFLDELFARLNKTQVENFSKFEIKPIW